MFAFTYYVSMLFYARPHKRHGELKASWEEMTPPPMPQAEAADAADAAGSPGKASSRSVCVGGGLTIASLSL